MQLRTQHAAVLTALLMAAAGQAAEWNQFRGPDRDNVSTETGLLKTWPAEGPKLLWKSTAVGEGYSTVSLSHGMVYTMGNRGDDEMIVALDAKTGKQKWATRNGEAYFQGRGNGPRGTPTIDGDLLFALGGSGNLSCLGAGDGKVKWQLNILKEFSARNISWGISESVLIDGDKLICTPGGREATVVALNKKTGKTIWEAAVERSPRAGYASPIVAVIGSVRQYVVFHSRGVAGVRATDGKVMWNDGSSANGVANCATPLLFKNYVFSASNYGKGGTLLKLSSTGKTTAAEQVYHTRDMKNHHGGMVIVDGNLYGSNSGILTCLDVLTGNVKWRKRGLGKGSITCADGRLYYRSERGPMYLLEATPTGYSEKGQFRQPNRSRKPAWPHPVVADGKLFLRDMGVLLCYDLKK